MRFIRCDLLHLVSIREDLEFTAIIVAFEGDTVSESADGSALVFPEKNDPGSPQRRMSLGYVDAPSCRGDTRNPVLGLNLFFIDYDSAEFSSFLIPLQRVGSDGGYIHLSSKVAGKITEVSSLFDNRTGTIVITPRCQGKLKRGDNGCNHLLDLSHQSGLAIDSYAQA
jgi:hypothetical protein